MRHWRTQYSSILYQRDPCRNKLSRVLNWDPRLKQGKKIPRTHKWGLCLRLPAQSRWGRLRNNFWETTRQDTKFVSAQSAESYSCILFRARCLGISSVRNCSSKQQETETEARLCTGRGDQGDPGLRLFRVTWSSSPGWRADWQRRRVKSPRQKWTETLKIVKEIGWESKGEREMAGRRARDKKNHPAKQESWGLPGSR